MLRTLFAAFVLLSLTACAAPPTQATVTTTPTVGFVTDLPSFEQFITTLPTPEQFRVQYPDVVLVLPGMIASKEMRLNHSRYFATLDAAGHISGGRFQ